LWGVPAAGSGATISPEVAQLVSRVADELLNPFLDEVWVKCRRPQICRSAAYRRVELLRSCEDSAKYSNDDREKKYDGMSFDSFLQIHFVAPESPACVGPD
jgi:hypothetical protein